MTVQLVTPPLSKALTTLINLNAELGASVDATLGNRLIDGATEAIHQRLGRPLYRAQFRETLAGSGRRRLMLSRYPIVSVESVSYDGSAITLSDVQIENPEAGFLDLAAGFTKTTNPLLWEVVYTAGYFLLDDSVTTSVEALASDDSFNSASGAFPTLIRAGDSIAIQSILSAANQGFHTLTAATASKLTTTSALTDEGPTASVPVLLSSLPAYYERACLDLVKSTFQNLSGAGEITKLKIGDVETTYSTSAVSDALSVLPGTPF